MTKAKYGANNMKTMRHSNQLQHCIIDMHQTTQKTRSLGEHV
jgi:hypothetical protein